MLYHLRSTASTTCIAAGCINLYSSILPIMPQKRQSAVLCFEFGNGTLMVAPEKEGCRGTLQCGHRCMWCSARTHLFMFCVGAGCSPPWFWHWRGDTLHHDPPYHPLETAKPIRWPLHELGHGISNQHPHVSNHWEAETDGRTANLRVESELPVGALNNVWNPFGTPNSRECVAPSDAGPEALIHLLLFRPDPWHWGRSLSVV